MSFLNGLLQSIGIEAPEGDIVVDAKRKDPRMSSADSDTPPLQLGNVSAIQERNDALKNGEAAAEHKGMFGTKGTLRDILGLVGDAFLLQSGNKPIYAPGRQQEKEGDALAGFTQNPQAAVERLSGVNPAGAIGLQNQTQDNQTKADSVKAMGQYKNDALHLQKIQKLSNLASNLYSSADTPEKIAAVTQRLGMLSQSLGVSPEDLGITPDMSPEEIKAVAMGNINPYQQQMLPINQQNADSRQASVGVARQNAGTNAGRLQESGRHNRVTEATGQQNAGTREYNAETGRQKAGTYERSAVAHGAAPGAASGPTKGMRRVINGVTYEWDGQKAVPVGGGVPLAQ